MENQIVDSSYDVVAYGDFFHCCSSGGRCLSVEYTDKVGELAKKHGLKLHIDGARIFNASVVSLIFSVLSVGICV